MAKVDNHSSTYAERLLFEIYSELLEIKRLLKKQIEPESEPEALSKSPKAARASR